MDGSAVTFHKQRGLVVSRGVAAMLALLFAGCMVATGLLVYKFASCTAREAATISAGGAGQDWPLAGSSHNQQLATHAAPSSSTPTPSPTSSTPTTAAPTKPPKMDVRLPRSIRPESYVIRIVPFIVEGNFTFHGEVEISVEVLEVTRSITLHANDLRVLEESVSVTRRDGSGGEVPVDRLGSDGPRQFLVLHLGAELLPGERYNVSMHYVGHLNDVLQGFYRSSYIAGNRTRWIAATQFQPTDARRAFPCFDEPALKATFQISIGRPTNMTSISNMPRNSEPEPVEGLPDYEWDHYGQSVPMSTYLVAFVVSDFGHLSAGANFSVWARQEALQQARYSLEIGPKILKYFEDYFEIKFPLPKIDMIALPDFAAGAMENWGLITYRETAMLYQQGVSTNNNKQSVATVVAHELAHQWFGNLVTPSWWTDLWLNEGFASYVEYLGVNAVEESWKILEQFVIFDLQNVFSLDALKSSHQISIEVEHPDEINEIFDRISYGKGASIIRMMDHFLTTDVFKKGTTNYLNSKAYQSSTQNDLWAALTAQAHRDGVLNETVTVKEIMDTWTLQTGFPVLTVSRDYETGGANLSQKRFILFDSEEEANGSDAASGQPPPLWWIPVTFTTLEQPDFEDTRPSLWLGAEPSVALPQLPASEDQWVVFNIQETGFYRVNYDERNWRLLIEHLMDRDRFEQVGVINRAQLLDDALNLARAGLLAYPVALDATRYLSAELEYLPWKAAFNAFGYVDGMLVKTGGYDKFKMYMLQLIQQLYEHTGFTDSPSDQQLTVYKRINVLNWACTLGYEDCVLNSKRQFQNWRSTPNPDKNNPISANLKSVVYCTALREGGQDEWDFAWQRYRHTNVGSEKDILLGALGCSRETWILSRYLDWSMTDNSGIRKQDAARVFAAVANNPIGQQLAYKFLRSKWDKIREYLGSSLFTINNIVRSSTRKINSDFELEDLMRFAKAHGHELSTATRAVEQAIEQARANVQWMRLNYRPITEWLAGVTAAPAS
ncbi:aminopeptidase N-like [Bacillus rossius redtenbacheri]|uniref:aminopeptidase N-like n=1 Tax=Bacillus rossius redtenbacheri TaxID=93214 RepID=UPI002FDEB50F